MSRKFCHFYSSSTQTYSFTFIFLSLFCINRALGGLDPYTVTRATGNTYVDIVGGTGTTAIPNGSWRNQVPGLFGGSSPSGDENLSNSITIPFTFYYDGSPQTQFRVGMNGFITFNTATSATGSPLPACGDADAYSGDNTTFSKPGTKGTISAIAPFYDDLEVEGFATNASMHYQTSGTAPDRVLTVQWRGMSKYVNTDNCTSCSYGNYNFQVKLYETSNKIEFVYGTMTSGSSEDAKNYSCGLNSASLTSSPDITQLLSQNPNNSSTFTSTHVSNLSTVPATNSKITFERIAPATGAPTCINYNFPANGATNQCRNAYISWSWPNCGGAPTSFDIYFGTASNPPLAVSDKVGNFYSHGNLNATTTYYWKIVPKNVSGTATINTIYSFTTGGGDVVTSITSSLGNTICTGQTTTLTVNGSLSEGSVYNWTSPFVIDIDCKSNPPILLGLVDCAANSRTFSSNSAGSQTYDVFTRGCNGTSSCSRIIITVVDAASAPTSISSPGAGGICEGASTTLSAVGGAGSVYQWYSGSCGGTLLSGSSNTITVTMTDTITYYVRRVDQCTGPTACSQPFTLNKYVLTVGGNFVTFADPGSQTICPGETASNLNGTLPTGGTSYTYLWESSTTSDSTGFAPASGINNTQGYIPGALLDTTWYRRIVIAQQGGVNCSDTHVSNVVQISAGSGQCNDGNACTNDFCENSVCRHECTLEITNPVFTGNSIVGCNDGTVAANVGFTSCTNAWNAYLLIGNTVHKSWNSTQGPSLSWSNVAANNYLMVATDGSGCADTTNITIGGGVPCSMIFENPDSLHSTPTSVEGCDDGTINASIDAFVCGGALAWTAILYDDLSEPVSSFTPTTGSAMLWENLPAGDYRIVGTANVSSCNAEMSITIPSGPPCRVQVQNVKKTIADCDNNGITADISVLTCDSVWYAYLYSGNYSSVVKTWDYTQGVSISWSDVPLGNYHLLATNLASCSDTADVILSCSDGDPCTNDACLGGVCTYTYKCEDNNPCTEDFCQANGVCLNQPIICNDGNACTNDACVNGACVTTPINCADNNNCTVDQCFSGNCTHTNLVCNDNSTCTNDFCQNGICTFVPICILNDNNACTDDHCVNRTCLHPPKNCSDNNSCTTDQCQAGLCVNNPVCIVNDGNPCTIDQCTNGSCVHNDTCTIEQCTVDANCNDDDLCTNDTCIAGDCEFIPVDCDDGVSCTNDQCDSLSGNCLFVASCNIDDGDLCTLDGCVNGACLHAAKNCDDASSCTSDFCQNGICVFQPLCVLNDQDACTNDFCLSGQCIHDDIFCNDGLLCTNDGCLNGTCVFDPIACDDGNACTSDSCFNGNCIFPFIPDCTDSCDLLICTDGIPCTVDSCANNNCVFPPVDCDDSNPCTSDSCDGGPCAHSQLPNCNLNISGAIVTEINIPVPGVTVKLTGAGNQDFVTSNDGLFNFNVMQGDDCNVAPSKSNDSITNNGVTTLDIIQIQREILAILQLSSPYKKIAADVNNSQTITTLDIVLIRTVILQTLPTFPNGRLWAFVNSDFVFASDENPFPFDNFRAYTNISTDQINQDFIGMKLGDVNDSWNPNIAKTGTVGDVQFIVNDYNAMPGDEIIVPVKVRDFDKITGYQFTLSWNPEVLQLLEVNNSSLNGFFGMNSTPDGLLTTLWFDELTKEITLPEDESVFDLKFKVTGEVGSYSEILISSELTAAEAYNENLDLLSIHPVNGMVKVDNTRATIPNSECCELKVVPNPFTNSTRIIFSIPTDDQVAIVVYDLLGKEVKHMEDRYKSGEHSIEWTGKDDNERELSTGLYHVRMSTISESRGVKVLLVK